MQRDPTRVADLADKGAVRIKRRGGGDLYLMRADRIRNADAGVEATLRALRGLLERTDQQTITAVFRDQFTWMDYLPREDQSRFVIDFVRAAQSSIELDQWAILHHTVEQWKNSASIYADPDLRAKLTAPLDDDHGPVQARGSAVSTRSAPPAS